MNREEGVTLIEVMIVVVIVGILAAIAIPAYDNYVTRSRRSDAFTALETVRAAQEMYRAEKGFYARDFVDGGSTVVAGCSEGMAGDNYTLNITRAADKKHYTTTAEAEALGKQADDFYFRLDQDGDQEYSSDKGSTWKDDKTWEELR